MSNGINFNGSRITFPDGTIQTTKGTANSTDSQLRDRATHTGTQAISTVDGLQTALDGKAATSHTHDDRYYTESETDALLATKQASGDYATLVNGTVPASQLPSYVDDVIEAANFASLPVSGESGKIYVALDSNKTYRWSGSTYVEISASPGSTDAVPEGSVNKYYTDARASAAAPVQSVAGRTGAVTLSKNDVGLSDVDNTSDLNKPVSTATQSALARLSQFFGEFLDLKANINNPTFTGTVSGVTKSMVGLGNVDNTSDVNKPVSTAQASADTAVQNAAATDATTKANNAQAFAVQRSNHTGTQPINTVDGLQTVLDNKQNKNIHSYTLVVTGDTNNSINTSLTLDGQIPGLTNRLSVPTQTMWTFVVKISAYNTTDNQGGWWIIRGGIRRTGTDNTILVGTPIVETDTENSLSMASVLVMADTFNKVLDIQVSGVPNKSIRWIGAVDICQTTFESPLSYIIDHDSNIMASELEESIVY